MQHLEEPPRVTRLAVIGLGRAGQARLRAIADSRRCALMATVSRRGSGEQPRLEDALAGADAVIVCTENSTHADAARRAMSTPGVRGVCVEFPLSLSLSTAARLFDEAAAKGVVLHVEHIELAAADAATAHTRRCIAAAGGFAAADMLFTGSPLSREWGHPAFAGIARLTRSWVALGPLLAVKAAWVVPPTPCTLADGSAGIEYELVATLRLASGASGTVTWTERRCLGATRCTTFVVQLRDGTLLDGCAGPAAVAPPAGAAGPAGPPAKGLFAADLACFLDELVQTPPGALSREAASAELAWMRTAQDVAELCPAPAGALAGDECYVSNVQEAPPASS